MTWFTDEDGAKAFAALMNTLRDGGSMIDGVNAALSAVNPYEWRPISEAPYGERIKLYCPNFPAPANQITIGIRYPTDLFWYSERHGDLKGKNAPTHWRPDDLPPAPEGDK